jgi:hypothetical protein
MSTPLHSYAIQCDKLRSKDYGEEVFTTLLYKAVRIPALKLLENCSLDALLDDGESYEDFVAQDPEAGCYRTDSPDGPVYFIQHTGFEFFFTADGQPPTYHEPYLKFFDELNASAKLAAVLLPANNALANGSFGYEGEPEMIEDDLEMIPGRLTRFRLFRNGEVIAAISVDDHTVDTIYVLRDHRREGIASELFCRVSNLIGGLEHSTVLTPEGKLFRASFEREEPMPTFDQELSYG